MGEGEAAAVGGGREPNTSWGSKQATATSCGGGDPNPKANQPPRTPSPGVQPSSRLQAADRQLKTQCPNEPLWAGPLPPPCCGTGCSYIHFSQSPAWHRHQQVSPLDIRAWGAPQGGTPASAPPGQLVLQSPKQCRSPSSVCPRRGDGAVLGTSTRRPILIFILNPSLPAAGAARARPSQSASSSLRRRNSSS